MIDMLMVKKKTKYRLNVVSSRLFVLAIITLLRLMNFAAIDLIESVDEWVS